MRAYIVYVFLNLFFIFAKVLVYDEMEVKKKITTRFSPQIVLRSTTSDSDYFKVKAKNTSGKHFKET